MIISSHQINNLLKAYNKEGIRANDPDKAQGKTGTVRSRGLDQTQVSEEAKVFQTALKAAQSTPEVREGKVAELREAIRTGSYSVTGEEIAEKMIGRALVDRLV